MFQAGCSLLVYSQLCVSGEFALPTDHHLSTTECFSCALCSELPRRSSTNKSSRPSLKLLLILGEGGDAKNKQCQETVKIHAEPSYFNPWSPLKICITSWVRDRVWCALPSTALVSLGCLWSRCAPVSGCVGHWHTGKLASLGAPQVVRNVTRPQSPCLLLSSLPHAALHSFGASCLNLLMGYYWPFFLMGSTNGMCSLAP